MSDGLLSEPTPSFEALHFHLKDQRRKWVKLGKGKIVLRKGKFLSTKLDTNQSFCITATEQLGTCICEMVQFFPQYEQQLERELRNLYKLKKERP